jgi:hypothetical protein
MRAVVASAPVLAAALIWATPAAPSTSAQRPAPGAHTNSVDGFRMTREPVVLRDPPGYVVYVRTNRPLPYRRAGDLDASLEVDGAHSGVRIGRSSPYSTCYRQDDDLLRLGGRPSSEVPLGTRLAVRLYVGDHHTPIRAMARLRPDLPPYVISPGPPPVADPDEPALRLLGCGRHPRKGPESGRGDG